MEILQVGDERIAKIIESKSFDDRVFYRLSGYTYFYQKANFRIIIQTLSGKIVKLSEREWDILLSAKDHPVSGSFLKQELMASFVQMRILIPNDSDEYQQYCIVMTILKTLAIPKKGIGTYTILPTTGCNARCVYCYEMGMVSRTMTTETADAVVDFICRTKHDGAIKITWFGGEPTMSGQIISRICNSLRDKRVSFSSFIVTNGVLFTEELVKEAKSKWNLTSAQISVDGIKKDYETRKAYPNPEKFNYEALLRAIHRLLDAGIQIHLRCNFDVENLPGLKAFADEIYKEFGDPELLTLGFKILFQNRHSESSIELQKAILKLRDSLDQYHFIHEKPTPLMSFRVNHCMTDADATSIVIDPEGFLYRCETIEADQSIGTIFDPDFHLKSESWLNKTAAKCKTCCFLPRCTPIYKVKCPDCFDYCKELRQVTLDHKIEKQFQ